MKSIYSLSLMARATYNLHALNNEKSDGNKTLIRNVGVLVPTNDTSGTEYATVNAISGNMFRHIFSSHLATIAQDMQLNISRPCIDGHPDRIWADNDFQAFLKESPDMNTVHNRVLSCTVTDICGMTALDSSIQIKRNSLLHVGWVSGLPDITRSEFHQFLRAQPDDGSLKPMPFSKGTASGVYAIAVQAEVARIGYNDRNQTYPNGKTTINRQGRFKALLLALAYAILQPLGANITSQLPHVMGVEGILIVSGLHTKAPLVSPLNANYQIRAEKQRQLMSQISDQPEAMMSVRFQTGEELLDGVFDITNHCAPAKYYHDSDS